MKASFLFIVLLAGSIFSLALAQVPQGTHVGNGPSMNFYRDTPQGKKLDFVITGESGSDAGPRTVLISQFELKSFRNGDPKTVQIIAQAPQCAVDVQSSAASDSGPLKIFTPTTNLYVQGVGFLFTQSNHFLIISNQVETRVVKSLLRSSLLAPAKTNAAASGTNAVSPASQVLKIFARRGVFDLNSNVVNYAGGVHVIDPQLDMTCDFLTVRFGANGAVENILARQNVVLTTTNNGRATGDVGYYYITNGNEMMQLSTNAFWRNGDEQARADEFLYDSTRRVLTGIGRVKVQWPNTVAASANRPAKPGPPLVGPGGYRFLFADYATLHFPPTNGPVQSMRARGNVIIVNQADESRATADQADYDRDSGRVELTGSPVWWNDNMEVKAQTLTADLTGKTYHARTGAQFKMRTGGSGAASRPGAASGHSTNQWLFIASDDMEYQTNRALFYRNVKTRLVQNDRLKDTLDCDLLTVNLTNNEVESGFACGNVQGETAPDKSGFIKTITCAQLDAYRNVRTGLMKTIIARTNVVIVEKGTNRADACNELTAGLVTAQFSPVTNQIQQAVAIPHVVIDQIKGGHKIHATSRRAVYTGGLDPQVKLTGEPFAQKDNYIITNADFLTWHPGSNSFNASGLFQMLPVKPLAAQTKP